MNSLYYVTILWLWTPHARSMLPNAIEWTKSSQKIPWGGWGSASTIYNNTLFVIGGDYSQIMWIDMNILYENEEQYAAWTTQNWPYDPYIGSWSNYMIAATGFTLINNYLYQVGPWGWPGILLIFDLHNKTAVSGAIYNFKTPINTTQPC